jgi:16S rRNA (guanine527-N7)-methyltransferase
MEFDSAAISAAIKTQLQAQSAAGIFYADQAVKTDQLADGLTRYLAELYKWNQAYNLTAVRDPQEMVPRHIFDSLTASSWLQGTQILDVGTGAGLPGIPLALARPELRFTLLDTNGKKVRFVSHVAGVLGLSNALPVQARVEKYTADPLFDTIISRAFSSLADFIRGSGQLLAAGGSLLAMKGRLPEEEMANVPLGWSIAKIESVDVPCLEAERHLIQIKRAVQHSV